MCWDEYAEEEYIHEIKYALESCRGTQNTRKKCCEIIKEGNWDDRQGLGRTGIYKEEGAQPFFGGLEYFFLSSVMSKLQL